MDLVQKELMPHPSPSVSFKQSFPHRATPHCLSPSHQLCPDSLCDFRPVSPLISLFLWKVRVVFSLSTDMMGVYKGNKNKGRNGSAG